MASHPFTFGQQVVTGEIARGTEPTDETGLAMALALGQPPDPAPPFATVPVLLSGQQIGTLDKVQWAWGDTGYRFRSDSGQTEIYSSDVDAVLQRVATVLGFTSPSDHPTPWPP